MASDVTGRSGYPERVRMRQSASQRAQMLNSAVPMRGLLRRQLLFGSIQFLAMIAEPEWLNSEFCERSAHK